MTIHEAVSAARDRLRAARIRDAEADLDARLLAEHLLGWDAARYFTDGWQPAPEGFESQYGELVARRASREPMAYITGSREFWDLTFAVSPSVLIPRPESELIVETALEIVPSRDCLLRVADVCTGSGCLAVALAHEWPRATFVATDLSPDAIAVARTNADRHRVADRIEFRCTNLLDEIDGPFDLIVANPPYVSDLHLPILQPEVRDHEPAVALFGGGDGLAVIRPLVQASAARLARGGTLIFEFAFGQDVEIEQIINEAELAFVRLRPDLQGIPRTAIARRP